jgi:hypothetical protein
MKINKLLTMLFVCHPDPSSFPDILISNVFSDTLSVQTG